jgi:hypothetical protein
VNADTSDDELPAPDTGAAESIGDAGAGKTTPGQRASGRRTTAPRRVVAEPTKAVAEPTKAMAAGNGLPSTPAGPVPVIPPPADPPTTELRAPASVPAPAPAPAPADGRIVTGPLPTNVYRARRPGVAILLIIPAVAAGVLFVRALAKAAFGDTFDLAGTIASICVLVSLPFLVAGLYGLLSGASHGAEQHGFKVWARPPLAYLLVGLAFVAAAGLAIR